MKTLASRLARITAALAVIALLAFGGLQVQATAASLDHCHPYPPGPEVHCDVVSDCMVSPECQNASRVSCVSMPSGENCCECII